MEAELGNTGLNHTGVASSIEEWEFQANGELDLFVLNVRYQSADGLMWTSSITPEITQKISPPIP